jgi:hypothetical protein
MYPDIDEECNTPSYASIPCPFPELAALIKIQIRYLNLVSFLARLLSNASTRLTGEACLTLCCSFAVTLPFQRQKQYFSFLQTWLKNSHHVFMLATCGSWIIIGPDLSTLQVFTPFAWDFGLFPMKDRRCFPSPWLWAWTCDLLWPMGCC